MKETEITVEEWMEAEAALTRSRIEPRPPGSMTAAEYGAKTKRSHQHARSVLNDMVKTGMAVKKRWRNGTGGMTHIFILKQNGKR